MSASALRAVVAALALGLGVACASAPGPAPAPGDPGVHALAGAIASLGDAVAEDEARRAAYSLFVRSGALRGDYRMVKPARFHNVLVNAGLRDRGLCCHFAEDLIQELLALDLRTLEVHWAVARHGSRLREHSSVLLVPRGASFDDGLVVDAWRNAGELYWTRPGDDRYPWELHPLDGDWARLHCR